VSPYDATLQAQIDAWHCAGDVAQTAMTDVANRAKFFEGTK
jgi:hypothetical protein